LKKWENEMSNKRKLEEDMLGPMDSPSFNPQPIHQLPATTSPSDNMDMLALSGPAKVKTGTHKGSKKDKKEETTFPSNKVLSFQDFIKERSTK
jgi:hypothetical protein